MLHPRESDLRGLFLVFIVLPLVAYILLGKWSEVSRKKDRIRVLARIAAEESFRAEAMAAAAVNVVPVVAMSKPNNTFHECARCFGKATTRCSRCKTVRYCSGKCQIIHWRQVHKHECQMLEYNGNCASPKSTSNEEYMPIHEQSSFNENSDPQWFESNIEQNSYEKVASDDPLDSASHTSGLIFDKKSSDKRNCYKFNREIAALDSSTETCSTSYDNIALKETFIRHKPKRSHVMLTKEVSNVDVEHEGLKSNGQHDLIIAAQNGPKQTHKSAKPTVEVTLDQKFSGTENIADELDVSQIRDAKGNDNVNKGFMKMIGLKRSSKHGRVETSEVNGDKHKKIKMLFPYEEFVKFFQYEGFDFSPRGLVNCGNSCYANAVLQCLTSTKPLTIYMLHRSHSRACRAKSWCLMCELEHHVMMLHERGEPLSLSRILVHMRSVNCQIGDGSQEDAHEFLRLLITSMQAICLEGLGGEDAVDPKLQETTFIQHTFGGQLRSKVKCSRCHHESVRYENIMDLTLEIFGWVESLEDALTQFTSPEDLDGENMYRCGRCATYVRARKQLAIQEAPNILTIVLKRFQEGSYGKINKCITYPDMLDMIPFMTGTDDMPPLYMLYGVVVHLDTMNASFSGHYISYVKDLRGNWFRIDDAQVHQVPSSQVMSEGAYILFYTRSSPRPPRNHTGKPSKHQALGPTKSKPPKSTLDHKQETTFQGGLKLNPSTFDFSDTTSSDWSIFTSSDDASFTTESTRDSFDHNTDPVSLIFNAPLDYFSRNTVSCSRFSTSKAHTRFMEPPYRLGNSGEGCRYVDGMSRTSGLNC